MTLSKIRRAPIPADNVILKIKIKHLPAYRFVKKLTKGKLSGMTDINYIKCKIR